MHRQRLLNFVVEGINDTKAILIQAIEHMRKKRMLEGIGLTNGPGKLYQSLGITMDMYGANLSKAKSIWVVDLKTPDIPIIKTKRIGIESSMEFKDKK